MSVQTAEIIDFQAYRQARTPVNTAAAKSAVKPVPFAMQPVMMWMPFMGFVPVMMMGSVGYGI